MFCPAVSPPYKVPPPPFPHPHPPPRHENRSRYFLNSRKVYNHNEIEKSDHNFSIFMNNKRFFGTVHVDILRFLTHNQAWSLRVGANNEYLSDLLIC